MPLVHHVRRIQQHPVYGLIIVLLALVSAFLLVFEVTAGLFSPALKIMRDIDLAIALIFLGDFVIGYSIAEDKRHYFKHNWVDLIAAIPITGGTFQTLRLLRVVRVVARIWRIGELAERLVLGSSRYIYAATIVTVVILSGSISFFSFEYGHNPKVNTFFDALWWTFVTAASVGYGDIVPHTVEGRIVGIILMIIGVGMVGSVAGLVGSHYLNKKVVDSMSKVKKEVKKAERKIETEIAEQDSNRHTS